MQTRIRKIFTKNQFGEEWVNMTEENNAEKAGQIEKRFARNIAHILGEIQRESNSSQLTARIEGLAATIRTNWSAYKGALDADPQVTEATFVDYTVRIINEGRVARLPQNTGDEVIKYLQEEFHANR